MKIYQSVDVTIFIIPIIIISLRVTCIIGASEIGRAGAFHQCQSLTGNDTVYPNGSSCGPIPLGSLSVWDSNPYLCTCALLCLHSIACSVQAWGGFWALWLSHHPNKPRPPCWYCVSMLIVVNSKPFLSHFYSQAHCLQDVSWNYPSCLEAWRCAPTSHMASSVD